MPTQDDSRRYKSIDKAIFNFFCWLGLNSYMIQLSQNSQIFQNQDFAKEKKDIEEYLPFIPASNSVFINKSFIIKSIVWFVCFNEYSGHCIRTSKYTFIPK